MFLAERNWEMNKLTTNKSFQSKFHPVKALKIERPDFAQNCQINVISLRPYSLHFQNDSVRYYYKIVYLSWNIILNFYNNFSLLLNKSFV